jgi:putative ABC transport system permease protein
MFMRMLIGAISRQKARSLTIALAMALGASLATSMLNVMLDVGDKVNQELKAYGANLTVVPKGASIMNDLYGVAGADREGEKYLAEEELPKLKTIFWAFNIVDYTPYLDISASITGPKGTFDAPVSGVWFDKRFDAPTGEAVETGVIRMKSWWRLDGNWPAEDASQCVVGANLASKLGVKAGDTLEAAAQKKSETITVSGVFHSGGDEDDALFAPLAAVQRIAGKPGLVSRIEVSALTTPENELARRAAQNPNSLSRHEWDTWYCTAYISSIAYQIEEVVTDARAKPMLSVAEGEGAILEKTQLLMLLLTVLCLACSALAISNLVTASVMERSTEIGLLEAVGASNLDVSVLILAEALVTTLTGGAVGYLAGRIFAQIIGRSVFGSPINSNALVPPIVAILVTVVTIVGSLPAIRLLLSMKPAETLHG